MAIAPNDNTNQIYLYKAPWLTPAAPTFRLPFHRREAGRISAKRVNVRSGPGEDYIVFKTLEKDETVAILGRQGDWFQVGDEEWIPAGTVTIDFEAKAERLSKQLPITVADDLQKNRWGGKAHIDGWQLTASVSTGIGTRNYAVKVTLENTRARVGKVAFFLHDSFANGLRIAEVVNGKAELDLKAYEAFTIGAYTEDDVMLELDLNEQNGLPKNFYWTEVSETFRQHVATLEKSRAVTVKNDLQKNRWGGKAADKGKQLTATVEPSLIPRNYKVTLTVSPENPSDRFTDEVAFFLHDSFNKPTRYKKAVDGSASITVTAYEDFTVGAYTSSGAMLELDLHEIEGFPKGFYAKENR